LTGQPADEPMQIILFFLVEEIFFTLLKKVQIEKVFLVRQAVGVFAFSFLSDPLSSIPITQ
jgi:hypothetical protein